MFFPGYLLFCLNVCQLFSLQILALSFFLKCTSENLKIGSKLNKFCLKTFLNREFPWKGGKHPPAKLQNPHYFNIFTQNFHEMSQNTLLKSLSSSQKFCTKRKLIIIDYLLCQCKIPIQNSFWNKNVSF